MTKTLAILLAAPLFLTACASGMGDESRYNADLRQLETDCRARGGILSPTGQQTSQPALDNVCKITGEPSTATQRPR